MSDDIFKLGIAAIYIVVALWAGGGFIYRKFFKKKVSSEPKYENPARIDPLNDGSYKKSLSAIRNGAVTSDDSKKYVHVVSGSFEEIFHMFMSISPEVVQTILKIEKTMIILQNELDKSEMDKSRIDELLTSMLTALNQLEDISAQLIHRMVEVYYENQPIRGEVKIDSQLIEGYITIVNNLEDISMNYTYHLQKLLKLFNDKYPEKLPEYTTISEKLVYVLYVVVTCCSSRLDKHINVYNITGKGEVLK